MRFTAITNRQINAFTLIRCFHYYSAPPQIIWWKWWKLWWPLKRTTHEGWVLPIIIPFNKRLLMELYSNASPFFRVNGPHCMQIYNTDIHLRFQFIYQAHWCPLPCLVLFPAICSEDNTTRAGLNRNNFTDQSGPWCGGRRWGGRVTCSFILFNLIN